MKALHECWQFLLLPTRPKLSLYQRTPPNSPKSPLTLSAEPQPAVSIKLIHTIMRLHAHTAKEGEMEAVVEGPDPPTATCLQDTTGNMIACKLPVFR